MITLSRFCTLNSAALNNMLPRTQDVIRYINNNSISFGPRKYFEIDLLKRPGLSEAAFRYAKSHVELHGPNIREWIEDDSHLDRLYDDSVQYINSLSGRKSSVQKMTPVDRKSVWYESKNIVEFLDIQCSSNDECEYLFRPLLPGCGVVGPSEADIEIGLTLWELKSLSHGFTSYALRQLVCYATLNHMSNNNSYTHIGLCNPYKKIYFSCTFDQLITNCSAMSAPRLLSLMAASMEEMDVGFGMQDPDS